MADDELRPRPLPYDPSGSEVTGMLDLRHGSTTWWLAQPGAMDTFACETMLADGSGHQTRIAIAMNVRRNHDKDVVGLGLMIHPEDAGALADQLAHTVKWLRAAQRMGS